MIFLHGSLPPATKLGQGYIFTGVCDSVHRGVCLSACWDTTPPGAGPPDQAPPLEQAPSQTRNPLDQAAPPSTEHAGRYGQRAGGTHPTGMQSCFGEDFPLDVILDRCFQSHWQHFMMCLPFLFRGNFPQCVLRYSAPVIH